MKIRIIGILTFLIIGLIIVYYVTEPKVEKWEYTSLPNNYVIKKIANDKIVLRKIVDNQLVTTIDNKKIGIDDYIAEFKYGNKYISLKCLSNDEKQINVIYYIVDSQEENIYGPYDTEMVYNIVERKIIDEIQNDWIKTITKPNNAISK